MLTESRSKSARPVRSEGSFFTFENLPFGDYLFPALCRPTFGKVGELVREPVILLPVASRSNKFDRCDSIASGIYWARFSRIGSNFNEFSSAAVCCITWDSRSCKNFRLSEVRLSVLLMEGGDMTLFFSV